MMGVKHVVHAARLFESFGSTSLSLMNTLCPTNLRQFACARKPDHLFGAVLQCQVDVIEDDALGL